MLCFLKFRMKDLNLDDINTIFRYICHASFCTYNSWVASVYPVILCVCQGIDEGPEGLKLISDIIREKMGIDISVLMGANIANEVAAEKFCETTIGKKDTCGCTVNMKLYNVFI